VNCELKSLLSPLLARIVADCWALDYNGGRCLRSRKRVIGRPAMISWKTHWSRTPSPAMISKNFSLTAAVFEGGLAVAAIGLGWLLGEPPLRTFQFEARHAALGIAATLPPLAMFWLCLKAPLPALRTIIRILDETLVPMFRECGLVQLAIISVLAGLGEEMLFRGVIQAAVAGQIGGTRGIWLGLAAAAVLFGMLHSITPTYALLAGLIGLYLGGLWLLCGNLLAPITTHAVYDFVVLVYLVKGRGAGDGVVDGG
jgi:uncharacterized protein